MKYSEIRRSILIFLIFILAILLAVLAAVRKDLVGLGIFFIILGAMVIRTIEVFTVKCKYCNKRPLSLLKSFPDHCPHCGEKL